jgi:hypothetical protein
MVIEKFPPADRMKLSEKVNLKVPARIQGGVASPHPLVFWRELLDHHL